MKHFILLLTIFFNFGLIFCDEGFDELIEDYNYDYRSNVETIGSKSFISDNVKNIIKELINVKLKNNFYYIPSRYKNIDGDDFKLTSNTLLNDLISSKSSLNESEKADLLYFIRKMKNNDVMDSQEERKFYKLVLKVLAKISEENIIKAKISNSAKGLLTTKVNKFQNFLSKLPLNVTKIPNTNEILNSNNLAIELDRSIDFDLNLTNKTSIGTVTVVTTPIVSMTKNNEEVGNSAIDESQSMLSSSDTNDSSNVSESSE
jgi:hypothetical protein